MDEKKDILLSIVKWLFIIVSIVFVIYATITMRGMYLDGSFYFMACLNNFDYNYFWGCHDPSRTRVIILFIQELPLILSNMLLHIDNKFILMKIYSCSLFLLPLLVLYLNYRLSVRTQRKDILYLSLFNYCLILIVFSIFSVSEMLIGSTLHFILWNYMSSKIDYKKSDIFFILLLILIMFETWEYVVVLGPIFFIASIMYAKREDNKFNKRVKVMIGIGAISASIFDIYMLINILLKDPDSGSYFIKELTDYIPQLLNLCTLFSISAVILLCILFFIKNKISIKFYFFTIIVYSLILIRLLCTIQDSLNPMCESHIRSVEFWFIPFLFFCIYIFDFLNKQYNPVKIRNYIIVVLLCGVFQTIWQCIHTYYWDANIKYMKSELSACKEPLYIPSEHAEISSFYNPELRRYIWWGNYAATSILFSDTYKIKTLLINYDIDVDEGNKTFRNKLFVIPEKNLISIPYDLVTQTKNKYWDLTEVAEALYKYDKKHNILNYYEKL